MSALVEENLRKSQLQQEFIRTDGVDPATSPLVKHQKMTQSPFRFLRGSSGLFYADMQQGLLKLPKALTDLPLVRVMGDCHLANFGFFTEEGSSGERVIFGPNDFDDACVGHAVWDLSRFAVSLLLAADYCRGLASGQYHGDNPIDFSTLKVATEKDADKAMLAFFQQYHKEMQRISADPERRFNAQDDFPKTHLLKPFLKKAIKRSAAGEQFLTKSTLAKTVDLTARPLQFKNDASKFTRLDAQAYQQVLQNFRPYVDDDIIDIVMRQGAGTGSLNLQRYYLLVGPKLPTTEADFALYYVVEAKQQRRSAPLAFFADLSPVNALNDAHLTVDCQRLMQRRPDLILDDHLFDGGHYLLRSLHHANVDLDPEDICLHPTNPALAMRQYAQACAVALAQAHSRSDRRSCRFEDNMAQALSAHQAELASSCRQYAMQQVADCQLLKQLLPAG